MSQKRKFRRLHQLKTSGGTNSHAFLEKALGDRDFENEIPDMGTKRLFLCQVHFAPLLQDNLKFQWIDDMLTMMFQWMGQDKETVKALREMQGDGEDLRPETVRSYLEGNPCCCIIARKNPEHLMGMYMDLGIARTKRCSMCLHMAPGVPIKTGAQELPHVCFYCYTHNIDLEVTKEMAKQQLC